MRQAHDDTGALKNTSVGLNHLNTTNTPAAGDILSFDAATQKFQWIPAPTSNAQTNADWNATSGSAQILNKPTLSQVATSGDYNDLQNKPVFSSVATSGNYDDLSNKPTLSSVAASGSYNDLQDKPTLAQVATTGDYTHLTNKPTIVSTLDELTDVASAGAANGQVLTYDAGQSRWFSADPQTTSDASSTQKGIVQLAGDLGGDATAPLVKKIDGIALPANPPTNGQVLTATSATTTAWTQPASSYTQAEADARFVRTVNGTSPDAAGNVTVASTPSTATPIYSRGAASLRAPSRILTRFASGHGWTGGADDAGTVLYGSQTYKRTTSGTGAGGNIISPTFTTPVDFTGHVLRIVLRVNDASRFLRTICYVTTGSGNVLSATIQANYISNEWVIITLSRPNFTVTAGTPNWTGVTRIDLATYDKGTGPVDVHFAAVELVREPASWAQNGVFILEADDGYASWQQRLLPITSARGIPVTANIITEW